MSETDLFELLEGHPFARGLTEAQLRELASCARLLRFSGDNVVFREEEAADTVYLILSGRVVLEERVPGKGDVQLESLTGGDLLGLSWLFPGGRWVLDARATEPARILALDARCVQGLMDKDAALGLALARQIIQQLYQRLERVRLQRLDVYRGER